MTSCCLLWGRGLPRRGRFGAAKASGEASLAPTRTLLRTAIRTAVGFSLVVRLDVAPTTSLKANSELSEPRRAPRLDGAQIPSSRPVLSPNFGTRTFTRSRSDTYRLQSGVS